MNSYHLLCGCIFFSLWGWAFWQNVKGINGERDIASRIIETIEKCE